MPTYANLNTALKTAIGHASVWPECKTNGIYYSRILALKPLQDKAGSLPIALIDIDLRASEEWGADNDTEVGEIYIYRVIADSESADTLYAKLKLLQTYLRDTALSCGQVLGYPSISQSMQLPLNEYFLATHQRLYSGACIFKMLIQDSPFD